MMPEIFEMTFDIIIPAYKPGDDLKRLLRDIAKQDMKPARVIIINTEKKYWDRSFEQIIPVEVHHIKKREFDHGGTRRMAAELSDAPFFVCMTQDARSYDSHLFSELLKDFNDTNIGAAYARQMTDDRAGEIERYTRHFNYPSEKRIKSEKDIETLGIKAWFLSDVCAAYRKSAYIEAGGFVKRTVFNEDMLMAAEFMKLGYSIAYEADAKVIHYHDYTAGEQFHRNFDLGASHAEYSEVFGRVKSESEGIRMVKMTARHLIKCGKPALIGKLIIQSAAKYLGYRLGRKYRKLPESMVLRMCGNKTYFKKLFSEEKSIH